MPNVILIYLKQKQNKVDKLKLCRDIALSWKADFTLLGINFDALLENMEININNKIGEIEKILGNWEYRFLTPYGRACIIKTLILPKLTHISLAVPTLDKGIMKKIDDLCYKFIWKGTDKVARKEAKTSEFKGGLNFPDINSSWLAFKVSWFRRLYNDDVDICWKKIFIELISEAGFTDDLSTFLNIITDLPILKRRPILNNKFWTECISSIKPTMLEFHKEYPEVYLSSSFWGSQIYLRNGNIINKTIFPHLSRHFETPLDLLISRNGTSWEFLTLNDLGNPEPAAEYEMEYIEIRYIIMTTLQKLKINLNSINIILPIRPPLLKLVSLSKKGCSKWATLLKKRFFRTANQVKHEKKWEEKLGNIQGPLFWDRCYKLTKSVSFDNKLKWLQQQIVRGSLKTNHIISKFTDISQRCTFCDIDNERILHLFWDCQQVSNFITEVSLELANRSTLNLYRKKIIFGDLSQDAFSVSNIIILHMKRFIWIKRCKKNPLNVTNFFHWLRAELKMLKICNEGKQKLNYLSNDSFLNYLT